MSKHYELMCIFPGTLAEDELPGLVEKVTTTITEVGGEHVHAAEVEKNRLAYPMKHIRYGYFALLTFQMEPGTVPTLQQKLRLMTGILRTILHTYDPSQKKALEDRLAVLKERIANRTGMGPAPEAETPAEEEKKVAPKKKAAPAKEEKKADAPKEAEEEKKAAEKEAPKKEEKEKVDMNDIDKKLDALLDDTVSSL